MRIGLILSLISSFQIFQQTVISNLHNVDKKSLSFSLASASFPLGQFISTLFLACRPISARRGLQVDAWLLIIGSIVAAAPSWSVMCVGRFIIGCGAGLGFVCSTIVLYDSVLYKSRPSHFFILGLSFAFATMVINVTPLLNIPDIGIFMLASAISAFCGIAYLLLQPHSEPNLQSLSSENHIGRPSDFPSTLIYVLMAMNVSIGVPAILAYSKGVFEHFGLDPNVASTLSVTFPIAQIVIIIILYNFVLYRKFLILGGYMVSTFIQAILLLTSFYSYLPAEHKTIAQCVLFWLLAVVVSVPCNTALCLITEQFSSADEQMTFASRGRCVMWVLATISTATFTWTMENHGFVICFAPYVFISTILLLLLVWIYPKEGLRDSLV